MTKAPTHYIHAGGGGGGGGAAAGGSHSPPNKNLGRQSPLTFWCLKTLLRMYNIDITCDTGDFRVHIFCPQTTQELPTCKKHHEAGPPKQALTTACGCIVIVKIGKIIACAN